MEYNRILIHDDQTLLQDIIEDFRYYDPALKELEKAFPKLELGDLTNDVFKDLVSTGTSTVKENFINSVNKELDTAGLKKESLRKPHIDSANETLANFEATLSKLKAINPDPRADKRRPSLRLKNISFIDGKFQVSAMDQEDISEDHCRIYLETNDEEQIYAKLKVVRDSLNDFYGYLDTITKENGLAGIESLNYAGYLTSTTSLNQFIVDDEIKQINPDCIKWVSEMIARAKSKKVIN